MKNISKVLVVILIVGILFAFTSCGPYAKEAGVYECYELKLNGIPSLELYEYYRITLNKDGTCLVESKGVAQSSSYSANATFSIKDGKIEIVTTNGSQSVTEVYDYVDGEIHMQGSAMGVTLSAKFAREGK